MILNKQTPHDLRESVAGSSGLQDERSEKVNPDSFTWPVSDAIPMCSSAKLVLMSQIGTHITNILMEADQAFVRISAAHPPRFEIKRLPIPSFDFFEFKYEPELPSGVRIEDIEQFLKLMFSRASSVSIIVREESAGKLEISCVDVEYKQTNHNISMKKDWH